MHLRQPLLNMLQRYSPTDLDEIEYKQTIISFIQNNKNCFERSLAIGHITGSAWLLNTDETHVLLMHHTKLDKWLQLGGHSDGDHNTLAVAIKEAQEESGIQHIAPVHNEIFDIDVHLIPATSKEKEHYHYDIRFLLRVSSDEQAQQTHESKELRWIGKNRNELPTDERSVVRMFNKWVTGIIP